MLYKYGPTIEIFIFSQGSVTSFPRLPSDCHREIDRGSCSSLIQMWGYDGSKCVSFTYKGCGGNLNRFFTKQQCEDLCQSLSTAINTSSSTAKSVTTTTNASRKLPAPPKYIIKTKKSCRKPRVRTLHQSYFYMLDWAWDRPLPLSESSRAAATYNWQNSEPTGWILISPCLWNIATNHFENCKMN